MPSQFEMVKEFHNALIDNPVDLDPIELMELRTTLIMEEAKELCEAIFEGNRAHILKELCDLLYVTHGAGVDFDLPVDEAYWRVHQSNMTKVSPPTYRADGKLLKGPNYVPPHLEDLV